MRHATATRRRLHFFLIESPRLPFDPFDWDRS